MKPSFVLHVSPDFIESNNLDPNVSPESITDEQWDRIKKIRAREAFTMDRGTYADPTFARVLSTVQYTPESHLRPRPKHRRRNPFLNTRYASMPVEDLIWTLPCTDGEVVLTRKAVLVIYTAQVNGRINVSDCTLTDVTAVVAAAGVAA